MKKYPKKVLKAALNGRYFESIYYEDGTIIFKISLQLYLALKQIAEESHIN